MADTSDTTSNTAVREKANRRNAIACYNLLGGYYDAGRDGIFHKIKKSTRRYWYQIMRP